MKKYFMLLAAAATVLAVSCAKEKNQPTPDPTPSVVENNTPQPIRFGVSSVDVKSPITKAAIENATGWAAGEKLYIYGIQQNNGVPVLEADQTYAAPILIDNVAADVPAAFTGSRNEIFVYKTPATQEYYYYGPNENDIYDFYGYYIGEGYPGKEELENNKVKAAPATWAPELNTAKTALQLPITIDGRQDIMIAGTDKYADYLAAGSPNIAISKLYSEASARKTVVPDLLFKHQLARFKFETKYGGAVAADAVNITINSIKIQDVPINGTMTLASTGAAGAPEVGTTLAADNTATNFADLYLWNADGSALTDVHPHVGTSFAPVGESIMLFPLDYTKDAGVRTNTIAAPTEFTVVLNMTQKAGNNSTTADREFKVKFEDMVDANGAAIPHQYAEAGKLYVVRLVVYGLEKIEITVSLEDWQYGGATELDSDAEDRLAVTMGAFTLQDGGTDMTPSNPYKLAVGGVATAKLATATIDDGNGGTIDILSAPSTPATVTYVSSNPKVATVTNGTTVTAVGTGTCKIYAYIESGSVTVSTVEYKYQNGLKSLDLAVELDQPASLPAATVTASVTPAEWDFNSAATGTFATISATASYNDGSDHDVTAQLAYSVASNDYFEVNASTGAITFKDLSAVTAPTAPVTVTFVVTLADAAAYTGDIKTVVVTVNPTPAP